MKVTSPCCINCYADEEQIGTQNPRCASNGRCPCHIQAVGKPYYQSDHAHCWEDEEGKPPCGQKIEHLKCCLCKMLNPEVSQLLAKERTEVRDGDIVTSREVSIFEKAKKKGTQEGIQQGLRMALEALPGKEFVTDCSHGPNNSCDADCANVSWNMGHNDCLEQSRTNIDVLIDKTNNIRPHV